MSTTAKKRYSPPKARNDAYTGLLAISLLALVVSCVLLYLDYSQYGTQKPQMPRVERTMPPATTPPPGPDVNPPAPLGGNPMPMGAGGPN